MKAELQINDRHINLNLVPENDEDGRILKALALKVGRPHQFLFRGFEYLKAEVEFLIQPTPSGD